MTGKTFGDMDNQREAVMYSIQVLDMYNKTLSPSELVERSSVLVDIGIAFASVGVDILALNIVIVH